VRWVPVVLLCACRYDFDPHAGDATADIGATPNAGDLCVVTPTGAAVATAGIGNTGGGGLAPDIVCAPGELVVGYAFDVTPLIGGENDEPIMGTVYQRCATLAIAASGTAYTTLAEVVVAPPPMTGTNCTGFMPFVTTPEVDCPSGMVAVGLVANQPTVTSTYNTISIECSSIAADGSVDGGSTMVYVAGTGSFADQLDSSPCPAGTAILYANIRGGCGQDQLIPECTATSCI
jgi:hypothetical protein